MAVERPCLLAMAQPDEQLRQCEYRTRDGEPRVVAGFSAVAWNWWELRAAAADAEEYRAAPWRRCARHERRIARTVQLRCGRADAPAFCRRRKPDDGRLCGSDRKPRRSDRDRRRSHRPLADHWRPSV